MKLKTQILLAILALIVLLTTSLSIVYGVLMGASTETQFGKRGISVATSLASNGRLGVMMSDSSQLSAIMDASMLDSEVQAIMFTDKGGNPIAERGTHVDLASAEKVSSDGSVEQLEAKDAGGNTLAVFRTPVVARQGDSTPIGELMVAISTESIRADMHKTILWSIVLCVIFLLTAVLAVNYIMRILQPLLAGIKLVATGDLTIELEQKTQDEVGKLIKSLNDHVAGLRMTVGEVQGVTVAVSNQVSQILTDSNSMDQGMRQQMEQSALVTNAVEEMTNTIAENSRNASDTAATAKEAKAAAEQGGRVVQETVNGMKQIADVVRRSATTVKELGKSSDQIGEIISVIDEIADQTNLLALNAAIEAARAGEQGRGFAVVADEVRKLAERTSKATKEIANMIKKIQVDTKDAVASMEEGTQQVDAGIQLADKAGESLKVIVGVSQTVTEKVANIAAASEQQTETSEQITRNVEAISTVTAETANGIQQIARAADDLNSLTMKLQELVVKFKLQGETDAAAPKSRNRSSTYQSPRSNLSVQKNGSLVKA
ncbi:MAG: methyl-accepting chemotaxis protein [Ignavibacteriae bacterium]|nr:methyl-accepting chemotaxis protein [Ignavibacteriota bacterium]